MNSHCQVELNERLSEYSNSQSATRYNCAGWLPGAGPDDMMIRRAR